jgi:hypothetical protein
MTVIAAATLWLSAAVTVTLALVVVENARQISAVPNWVFVRRTNCHVRLAPVTLDTDAVPETLSEAMKARNSSFGAVVEKAGEVMVVLVFDRPVVTVASIAIPATAVKLAVPFAPLIVTA